MKKTPLLTLLILIASSTIALAQTERPQLVVGIIVDQMRQEYLYRFENHYGENGFKRLMNEGFEVKNGHYDYIPTYTGPGHASVYTGTTPRTHGIISNSWYSRELKGMMYCAGDSAVTAVGGTEKNGKISARNLLSTTITDELKLFTQGKSKVVGVAIKDRGSSLPAGHMADGAYWYDSSTGTFMSSTYYIDELPKWVQKFNKQDKADDYLKQKWNTVKSIETYVESAADNNPYETPFKGQRLPEFPYDLKKLRDENGNFGLISNTPFGNSLTTDFALAAIEGEALGDDEVTDFLALSYSSTDYVGHQFGPHSKEVQDTYIRLDQDLARLFEALDNQLGKDGYLVFLSADHAVADVPNYLKDLKVPAGNFVEKKHLPAITTALNAQYGVGDWLENASSDQVFLNLALLEERKVNKSEIQAFLADQLNQLEGVAQAFTGTDMTNNYYNSGSQALLQAGYNLDRSGDILLVYEPGWISSSWPTGTTHGSGYTYDTHVPILFYGWGIPKGSTVKRYAITDIAPTLSMLLNIKLPNGASGEPILEIFE
ncbi:MAG: alkaline phosphatase family protein [Cyclobacteriaceae bacterium]